MAQYFSVLRLKATLHEQILTTAQSLTREDRLDYLRGAQQSVDCIMEQLLPHSEYLRSKPPAERD